ncbi:hypothetical protein Mycch_4191 [Mycolicibacterium chubuense NBB4]|uniref:Uncharacterized protein n=2 Tax=Mycolicibacterium chubuense TaxID=1800 RepID=I4BNQ1_MYCCN|nr:hypothetical protein Mycch_4191 [Mycolicibacterium chubuense NBB4]
MFDGDRTWGSLTIRPDRLGMICYRLVVYPPGISTVERRRLRVARGWPAWGPLLWIACEILLPGAIGPWAALALSTVVAAGAGVLARRCAGRTLTGVRCLTAVVLAGYADPESTAARDRVLAWAETLLGADDDLARGDISIAAHEMAWWRVYDDVTEALASRQPDVRRR